MPDKPHSGDFLKQDQVKLYSIVIPVYNEEESLKPLLSEIINTMTALMKPYEIIFVNDCSDDQSKEILDNFQLEFPEVIRTIHFKEHRGQTRALRSGLDDVRGQVAVTLDADLQNDPADIPQLIKKLDEGLDCVCAWRKARSDKPLKSVLSKIGNISQRMVSGLRIHDVSCTLRAYKKECISRIALNWEGQHRFIPLSLSLQGYKIGEIVSNHRKRQFGYTKYSHKRIFAVVKDFFRVLAAEGKR